MPAPLVRSVALNTRLSENPAVIEKNTYNKRRFSVVARSKRVKINHFAYEILSQPGHFRQTGLVPPCPLKRHFGPKTPVAILAGVLLAAPSHAPGADAAGGKIIRLASTRTKISGLLGRLLPEFKRDSGYSVHVIAVGTGNVLRMGRDGAVLSLLALMPNFFPNLFRDRGEMA